MVFFFLLSLGNLGWQSTRLGIRFMKSKACVPNSIGLLNLVHYVLFYLNNEFY